MSKNRQLSKGIGDQESHNDPEGKEFIANLGNLHESPIGKGAIVESGSTPDGHYVRWENGEQVCFFVHNHDAGNVSNQSTYYPVEFLSDDTWTTYQVTNRRETTSTDAARRLMRDPSRIIEVSVSGSSTFVVSHSGDASTDGETVSFEVIAWGFWK